MALYLAAAPVINNDFVGLGTASGSFPLNTVVVPANATITGIVLSIRNNVLAAGQFVTATLFRSACGFAAPVNTGITVTVAGPSNAATPNCCEVSSFPGVAIPQCELLSVQINTNVAQLTSGVAVTIFFTIP
jgi:hypothetical protein